MLYEITYQSKTITADGFSPVQYDITQCSRMWSWNITLRPEELERTAGGWEFTVSVDNVIPASVELSTVMMWESFAGTVHLLLSLHSECQQEATLRTFPFTADIIIRRFDEVVLTLSLRHRGYTPTPYVDIKTIQQA